MYNAYALRAPERIKLDACIAKLKAITVNEYHEYEPLVLEAVTGIGFAAWKWLDEGPGYRVLTGDYFWRLRTVRNRNAALFKAIEPVKPKPKARKPKPKAPKVWGFNTGRLYQADGQRITVAEMPDGRVLFNDHGRGIFGALKYEAKLGPPTARQVMTRYDHNEYTWDMDAAVIKAKEWPTDIM